MNIVKIEKIYALWHQIQKMVYLEILSIPYSESNRKRVSYALKQIKSSRGPA